MIYPAYSLTLLNGLRGEYSVIHNHAKILLLNEKHLD